ncbi:MULTISPECIES: hypothetical protein [Mycobacteriaceae]|uniref:hypothetical protein n=1 Tax=Mycobacteriaceae TaxID=1762 RepID=UPI0007EAF02E|nr:MULTISPECIES: hypothetical protein [Mycobacteriaceae]OBF76601.1 hypothetical protein A5751_24120 [Mycolicibacterium fortuitum]TMS50225.1 hypothetical protein E0T84_24425 [Mycobacterium sp. DBP42]
MTTPTPAPSAEAITDALHDLGIDGSGAAEQAWRSQLAISTDLSRHLQSIVEAVGAAKQRAESALAEYTANAPTAAEIEAAQQELLAASTQDDPRNPQRLAEAENKLGELLARQQAAEDKYERDSTDNAQQLDSDRKTADEALSPEARAKLAQLLGALAGPPAAMPAGAPAGAPAGPPPAAGAPASGVTPMSGSGGEDSGFSPGGSYIDDEQPGQTHTSSNPAAVSSAPTLVNAATNAQVGAGSAPVATSGQPAAAASQPGAMHGGFMPPMAPGMGMGGAGQNGPKPDSDQRKSSSTLDRDELLNGDDLLNRSVKGRL